MSNVTIAIVQIVIALIALIISCVMQVMNSIKLASYSNPQVKRAYQYSVASAIMTALTVGLVIGVGIFVIVKRQELEKHSSKFVYIGLVLAGMVLFASGVFGVLTAVQLQCIKGNDAKLAQAHRDASITSVVGIVGAMALLGTQLFIRREKITDKVKSIRGGGKCQTLKDEQGREYYHNKETGDVAWNKKIC